MDAAPGRLEEAKVSGQVTSQAKQRPRLHGVIVAPSGLCADPGISPDGSFIDGIPALLQALNIMSFTSVCLNWRLEALFTQDNPWAPRPSTGLPHTQVKG